MKEPQLTSAIIDKYFEKIKNTPVGSLVIFHAEKGLIDIEHFTFNRSTFTDNYFADINLQTPLVTIFLGDDSEYIAAKIQPEPQKVDYILCMTASGLMLNISADDLRHVGTEPEIIESTH